MTGTPEGRRVWSVTVEGKLLEVQRTIAVCVLVATLAVTASAGQRVEVYNGNRAEGDDLAGDPEDNQNTLVWADGKCKEGILTEGPCKMIGAETAARHVNEVLDVLPGGTVWGTRPQ